MKTRFPGWLTRRGAPEPREFDFAVGRWRARVADGLLWDGSTTRRLEPRVMAVLRCLAERPGLPVTKRQLLQEAWGDVAVSDGAVVRTVVVLRKALGDDARHPAYVRTLARRGYVLVAPVRRPAPDARPGRSWAASFAAASAVALVTVALVLTRGGGPGRLLVEPFQELDTVARSEEWGEALQGELATRLTRAPGHVLFVGDSDQPAHPRPGDVILTGSVRREDDHVRVSCRLSEEASARLVCAGTCDLPVTSRLRAQAAAAEAIAGAVLPPQ